MPSTLIKTDPRKRPEPQARWLHCANSWMISFESRGLIHAASKIRCCWWPRPGFNCCTSDDELTDPVTALWLKLHIDGAFSDSPVTDLLNINESLGTLAPWAAFPCGLPDGSPVRGLWRFLWLPYIIFAQWNSTLAGCLMSLLCEDFGLAFGFHTLSVYIILWCPYLSMHW